MPKFNFRVNENVVTVTNAERALDELSKLVENRKYNLGELILDDKGRLKIINNHESACGGKFSFFSNDTITTSEENFRVRQAVQGVIDGMMRNGDVADSCKAGVYKEISERLTGNAYKHLPLSRREVCAYIKILRGEINLDDAVTKQSNETRNALEAKIKKYEKCIGCAPPEMKALREQLDTIEAVLRDIAGRVKDVETAQGDLNGIAACEVNEKGLTVDGLVGDFAKELKEVDFTEELNVGVSRSELETLIKGLDDFAANLPQAQVAKIKESQQSCMDKVGKAISRFNQELKYGNLGTGIDDKLKTEIDYINDYLKGMNWESQIQALKEKKIEEVCADIEKSLSDQPDSNVSTYLKDIQTAVGELMTLQAERDRLDVLCKCHENIESFSSKYKTARESFLSSEKKLLDYLYDAKEFLTSQSNGVANGISGSIMAIDKAMAERKAGKLSDDDFLKAVESFGEVVDGLVGSKAEIPREVKKFLENVRSLGKAKKDIEESTKGFCENAKTLWGGGIEKLLNFDPSPGMPEDLFARFRINVETLLFYDRFKTYKAEMQGKTILEKVRGANSVNAAIANHLANMERLGKTVLNQKEEQLKTINGRLHENGKDNLLVSYAGKCANKSESLDFRISEFEKQVPVWRQKLAGVGLNGDMFVVKLEGGSERMVGVKEKKSFMEALDSQMKVLEDSWGSSMETAKERALAALDPKDQDGRAFVDFQFKTPNEQRLTIADLQKQLKRLDARLDARLDGQRLEYVSNVFQSEHVSRTNGIAPVEMSSVDTSGYELSENVRSQQWKSDAAKELSKAYLDAGEGKSVNEIKNQLKVVREEISRLEASVSASTVLTGCRAEIGRVKEKLQREEEISNNCQNRLLLYNNDKLAGKSNDPLRPELWKETEFHAYVEDPGAVDRKGLKEAVVKRIEEDKDRADAEISLLRMEIDRLENDVRETADGKMLVSLDAAKKKAQELENDLAKEKQATARRFMDAMARCVMMRENALQDKANGQLRLGIVGIANEQGLQIPDIRGREDFIRFMRNTIVFNRSDIVSSEQFKSLATVVGIDSADLDAQYDFLVRISDRFSAKVDDILSDLEADFANGIDDILDRGGLGDIDGESATQLVNMLTERLDKTFLRAQNFVFEADDPTRDDFVKNLAREAYGDRVSSGAEIDAEKTAAALRNLGLTELADEVLPSSNTGKSLALKNPFFENLLAWSDYLQKKEKDANYFDKNINEADIDAFIAKFNEAGYVHADKWKTAARIERRDIASLAGEFVVNESRDFARIIKQFEAVGVNWQLLEPYMEFSVGAFLDKATMFKEAFKRMSDDISRLLQNTEVTGAARREQLVKAGKLLAACDAMFDRMNALDALLDELNQQEDVVQEVKKDEVPEGKSDDNNPVLKMSRLDKLLLDVVGIQRNNQAMEVKNYEGGLFSGLRKKSRTQVADKQHEIRLHNEVLGEFQPDLSDELLTNAKQKVKEWLQVMRETILVLKTSEGSRLRDDGLHANLETAIDDFNGKYPDLTIKSGDRLPERWSKDEMWNITREKTNDLGLQKEFVIRQLRVAQNTTKLDYFKFI